MNFRATELARNHQVDHSMIRHTGMNGSILLEIIIALAVIVLLVGVGSQLMSVGVRTTRVSKDRAAAVRLTQEATEALRAIIFSNDAGSQGWNRMYLPPDGTGDASTSKGILNPYYPKVSSTWILATGTETVVVGGTTYARKMFIDNVSRDPVTGSIESAYNPSRDDPGTQKVTVVVSASGSPDVALTQYVTRSLDEALGQSDWSGIATSTAASATSTTTNITTSTAVDRGNTNCSGGGACFRLEPQ
ncbi:MAG: hypothetical protein A2939_04485 [Parcubacteria group bacterium RIFCSPLOWO2_01_FULL_48_18]|nr:MAG: hypothetical protein A2939_04485 [Parcubacteria group bacterium RIFCSPLOWO2_01_FULL_48_18]